MASIKNQLDLYESYKRNTKPKEAKSILGSPFLAPVLFAIAGLSVWCVLIYISFGLKGQIKQINDYLTEPTVVDSYNESVKKQEELAFLNAGVKEAEGLSVGLSTYPIVSSSLLDEVGKVGGDDVNMVITGYHSKTGELAFGAHSRFVIDIPGYILALQNTQLFHTVEYTGYEYDAVKEEYVLRLRCTLKAQAGRESNP